MTDKKIKTDFGDYYQINMQDPYQVEYWTNRWNITLNELLEAAKKVDSTIVSEIEDYLKKNRREGFDKTSE